MADTPLFGPPGLRLLQFYSMLRSSNKAYPLTHLAHLFRCSRQSILRMAEQLERAPGVKFKSWRHGKERYFMIAASGLPIRLNLNADTLRHIALCQDILRHLLPQPIQLELRKALASTVGIPTPFPNDALESFADPMVKGRIDYTPFQSILEDVQRAMRERRLCQVKYCARSSGEQHDYLIAPLRILAYREALYIRCRLYDSPATPTAAFRTLALHRVQNLTPNNAIFTTKSNDDKDPHFGFPFHPPIRIRAAFHGPAATYVSERIWSHDQKIEKRRDGTLELAFTTTSTPEVIAWILSFGPDAELLEPRKLREEIYKSAATVLQIYESVDRHSEDPARTRHSKK